MFKMKHLNSVQACNTSMKREIESFCCKNNVLPVMDFSESFSLLLSKRR